MANMMLYAKLRDVAQRAPHRIQDPNIVESLDQAVPFDIQPAYNWLAMEKTGESLGTLMASLDVCVPPFGHTFFEYMPEESEEDRRDTPPDKRITHTGVIFYTERMTPETRAQLDQGQTREGGGPWKFHGIYIDPDGSDPEHSHMFDVPDDAFLAYGRMVHYQPGNGVVYLRGIAGLLVFDGEGRILKSADGEWIAYGPIISPIEDDVYDTETERQAARTLLSESLYTALFSCQLLHCKNVSTAENRLPRQQARQRERQQLPPITWKTLVVTPVYKAKPTTNTIGQPIDQSATMHKRQHVVRGHFAHYGTDGRGKLFGKHTGTYWIPPMVRGSAGEGLVVKQYHVRPAKDTR